MKRAWLLISFDLKYLFRQKFLRILFLIGVAFALWQSPRYRQVDYDYDIFTKSYEELDEFQQLEWDLWNYKKEQTLKERERILEKAQDRKVSMREEKDSVQGGKDSAQSGKNHVQDGVSYEWKYFDKLEKIYSQLIRLETWDYTGWETFFLIRCDMTSHNLVGMLEVILIVSAGLLLLTRERENRTFFWYSWTGCGTKKSLFLLKMVTICGYGMLVHLAYDGVYILYLALVNHLDMRHVSVLIQNITGYGMCDVQISIFIVLCIDILLKCLTSMFVLLFTFLLSLLLKKYLFLFFAGLGIGAGLYYQAFQINQEKNYDLLWRLNPFSSFQLNEVLSFDVIKLGEHAVDIRVAAGIIWVVALIALMQMNYHIWRKYPNASI